ncbi:MAG: phosphoribosylformylglycinamidine synthase subunit PurS [Cytophagales bacterium]|nr:MAG: phosphoribosylformylglycinamidine synthase subunit PurS [Cytophagales bacterium]TAF59360.1 MAG: phosphoribosylformylglycinamidine synthase subunit PurS [Cytophagales bacterium]
MKQYLAKISVLPIKEILDPQGKAVMLGLNNLGVSGVQDIRVGKQIEMKLSANSTDDAKKQVETACQKLLANLIMEYYEFEIAEL